MCEGFSLLTPDVTVCGVDLRKSLGRAAGRRSHRLRRLPQLDRSSYQAARVHHRRLAQHTAHQSGKRRTYMRHHDVIAGSAYRIFRKSTLLAVAIIISQ